MIGSKIWKQRRTSWMWGYIGMTAFISGQPWTKSIISFTNKQTWTCWLVIDALSSKLLSKTTTQSVLHVAINIYHQRIVRVGWFMQSHDRRLHFSRLMCCCSVFRSCTVRLIFCNCLTSVHVQPVHFYHWNWSNHSFKNLSQTTVSSTHNRDSGGQCKWFGVRFEKPFVSFEDVFF